MNFNKANMMKGKDRFTSAEIVKLRELITERQNAPRNSQKQLRNRMRKIGFFGRDDWGIIDCTLDDLDELIDTGKIKIIDKTTSTIITDKSKSKNAIINQGTNKNKDSNWINRIDFGEIESFKNEGFYGVVSVKSLLNNYSQIPAIRGVYMVLRIITKEPFFLDKGSGGYFKGTDPNVAIKILQEKWVYNTPVLYIGKAGGEGKEATLRSRILQYLKFGQGKPVGHKGGRYIWQLSDAEELLFCWKPLPTDEPEDVESMLISEFKHQYAGKRPFANLNK